jgi:hypothetical protein
MTLGYDAEERLSTLAAGAATQSRTYDSSWVRERSTPTPGPATLWKSIFALER